MHGRVVLRINIGPVSARFKGISFGFTFNNEDVYEDAGTVTLDVSVISGTLQCRVDIAYSTMELATNNAAKSKMDYIMYFFLTNASHIILCL